jgi:hypothetical protein
MAQNLSLRMSCHFSVPVKTTISLAPINGFFGANQRVLEKVAIMGILRPVFQQSSSCLPES